jgi:hypothetical protein
MRIIAIFLWKSSVLAEFPTVKEWLASVPPPDEIPSLGIAVPAAAGKLWPMQDEEDEPLFIRGCYSKVFKIIRELHIPRKFGGGIVLTGNPGIGKVESVMEIYAILDATWNLKAKIVTCLELEFGDVDGLVSATGLHSHLRACWSKRRDCVVSRW